MLMLGLSWVTGMSHQVVISGSNTQLDTLDQPKNTSSIEEVILTAELVKPVKC
jgi:hypothetical protein